MKLFFACLFFLLPTSLCFSQDSIINRIVLVGDGGLLENGRHPVAQAIKKTVPMDARTTIVFLGDNLYSTGLPYEEYAGYKAAKNVLDSQLSIADGTAAKIYMIPGNHDWKNGAADGFSAILREQTYVDLLNKNNVEFFPKDGCPGPKGVNLGSDVLLVMFDSQWFLHTQEKPGIESECDFKTPDEVYAELDNILTRNPGKLVIIACHHTFKSISPHGGYYTWKQHIFPFTDISKNLYIPLPIIGSIYPLTRGVFGTPQDLHHPNYEAMINGVQGITKGYPNVLFAAGHDHSLQFIKDSNYHYIVSGSGSKTNRVSLNRKKSLYSSDKNGFAVLEVSANKWVTVTYYTVTDSTRLTYRSTFMNYSTIESPESDTIKRVVENPELIKYQDTITIAASDRYKTNSFFRKLIMGTNYREAWATPVNMKVLNIRKEKGGMTLKGVGGGRQSKTFTLVDKKGVEWILKVMDKNPERVIPENFRSLRSDEIGRDFIS
ncbi:MAG TPA: metallophosphoesterase, partial [Chitinophagaceae bacterium]|nr:metallophosphoesterase [Chitinophagaceae bacterium]